MEKKELKEIIKEDKSLYFDSIGIKYLYRKITKHNLYEIGKYIIISRKAGYYNLNRNGFINKLLSIYYSRKKNILGRELSIELGPDNFGRRLKIFHGNIVINKFSYIGNDVIFYGSNCVGNKGLDYDAEKCVPIINDRVSIGVGTKIIGNVEIAEGVKISSMSLVNKSISKEDVLVGGIPAKIIEKKEQKNEKKD